MHIPTASMAVLLSASGFMLSSAAQAASATCLGGNYRVETTDFGLLRFYVNDSLTFRGTPVLKKIQDGHNYLDVSPNVGPNPADVVFEYSFVVPQFATGQVYYSYLDSRVSRFFPTPLSNVTRTPLTCQIW